MNRSAKSPLLLLFCLLLVATLMLTPSATKAQTVGTITLDKTFVTLGSEPPPTPDPALVNVTVTDPDLNPAVLVNDDPSAPDLAAANNIDGDPTLENAFAGFDENGNGIADDWIFAVSDGVNGVPEGEFFSFGSEFASAGTILTLRVSAFPILDRNADGVINFQDVTVTTLTGDTGDLELRVFSISSAEGLVTLISDGETINSPDADLNNDGTNDAKLFRLSYNAPRFSPPRSEW